MVPKWWWELEVAGISTGLTYIRGRICYHIEYNKIGGVLGLSVWGALAGIIPLQYLNALYLLGSLGSQSVRLMVVSFLKKQNLSSNIKTQPNIKICPTRNLKYLLEGDWANEEKGSLRRE